MFWRRPRDVRGLVSLSPVRGGDSGVVSGVKDVMRHLEKERNLPTASEQEAEEVKGAGLKGDVGGDSHNRTMRRKE